MKVWLAVVATLAACTGDDDSPTVVVHAKGSALVVSLDGEDRWRQVTLDAEGTGSFAFTSGAYGLGVFCPPTELSSYAWFYFDTEPGQYELSCESIDHSVQVSGTTEPGADVWIFHNDRAAADGTYKAFVPAGHYNVAAITTALPKRILIERNVDMTADRVLDLPVATAGVEMRAVTPIVVGRDPSEVTISADMNPGGNTIYFGSHPTTIHVPPSSVLLPTDHAAIAAYGRDCSVQQPLTADTPTFQMPAPFTASIDRGRATWGADPAIDWDRARTSLDAVDRSTRVVFSASTSWLTATGYGDSFPVIDTRRMPGWKPQLVSFEPGDAVTYEIGRTFGRYDGDYIGCSARGTLTW